MTQIEALKEAEKYLELAIDTFPDKDDEIRRYNGVLYGMIDMIHVITKDYKI